MDHWEVHDYNHQEGWVEFHVQGRGIIMFRKLHGRRVVWTLKTCGWLPDNLYQAIFTEARRLLLAPPPRVVHKHEQLTLLP